MSVKCQDLQTSFMFQNAPGTLPDAPGTLLGAPRTFMDAPGMLLGAPGTLLDKPNRGKYKILGRKWFIFKRVQFSPLFPRFFGVGTDSSF